MFDKVDWHKVRASFVGLDKRVYLNAAGMAPLPREVCEAGCEALRTHFTDVRRFVAGYLEASARARSAVASFFGTEARHTAFVGTTGMGMNLLALQLSRVRPSHKHVVSLKDEFPSSTLAWRKHGFEIQFIEPDAAGEYDVARIVEAVRADTAAVVVSYVHFGTGVRVDVPRIAEALAKRGVPCVVNATQAAGVVPIDLKTLPVAAMLVSGNKWMLSGPGTAVLYMSPELRDEHFPPVSGWLSSMTPLCFDNREPELVREASGLEVGLGSLVPIQCAGAGATFLADIGVDRVYSRVMDIGDFLFECLRSVGADIITPEQRERRAGIVCVRRPDAADWIARLEEHGIIVVGRGPGVVRISPHIYNLPSDIERMMELW